MPESLELKLVVMPKFRVLRDIKAWDLEDVLNEYPDYSIVYVNQMPDYDNDEYTVFLERKSR